MRRLTFLSLILLTCSITISSFSSCCTYVFDSDNKLILCCSIAQQIISHIQAWGDGVQVLAWPGTGLSVWTLSCVGLHRSLKLLNDSIFRQAPAAIYSLFHGFSSIRTAVALSLSLDQRHGTCSKTICVSRTCKLLFSSYTEDVSFWSVLRTLSTLEALFATMRYINWRSHLHLHLH